MGEPRDFLKYERADMVRAPVSRRVRHFREFERPRREDELRLQAARCMDCGTPFCHSGCPLGNLVPEWNKLLYRGRHQEAIEALHSTNNFPEITGRVCPAMCETSCVLGLCQPPVTIRQIEHFIAETAQARNLVIPKPPTCRTGRRIAVVGSGPAGLTAAMQLNHRGHTVTVFERSDRLGGLLRYGIPDFKLEKHVLDRRLQQMRSEGVQFETNAEIGVNLGAEFLRQEFHAILLAAGTGKPRDLAVPGRELGGIHQAMEFLTQQNRRVAGDRISAQMAISARAKRVVVIGGGDSGADCVGTANRQGAKSVVQLEILSEPPAQRPADNPWPAWPRILRTCSSHEEGCHREFAVDTRAFEGSADRVSRLSCVRVEWRRGADGTVEMSEIPGSGFALDADLVLLALGFVGVGQNPMIRQLGVKLDGKGNVSTEEDMSTSVPGVFAAGDVRRGQSLVVWAIAEGRQAAEAIDQYLLTRVSF